MAMVFHCSSLLSPSKQVGTTSWQQLFSRKFKFEGDPTMLPYDPRNLILSSRGAASVLSKIYRVCPRDSSLNWLQNKPYMKSCMHMSPSPSEDHYQSFSVNQDAWIIRFPATALLMTNAMFLAMPLEALAETSQADNFFYMPLFLLVALIGATVGA